jgi:hypothetical protein
MARHNPPAIEDLLYASSTVQTISHRFLAGDEHNRPRQTAGGIACGSVCCLVAVEQAVVVSKSTSSPRDIVGRDCLEIILKSCDQWIGFDWSQSIWPAGSWNNRIDHYSALNDCNRLFHPHIPPVVCQAGWMSGCVWSPVTCMFTKLLDRTGSTEHSFYVILSFLSVVGWRI